jgi:hypothetical protein
VTFKTLPIGLALFAGCTVLAACGTDKSDAAAGPVAPTAVPSTTGAGTISPAAVIPVDDGCPADVNLMYQRLEDAPAIRDELDSSLSGLEEPACADGWAMSRTVVKNADPSLVLFKYNPNSGWTPVATGTDGVCDGTVKVPAAIQAKLGAGC